MYVKCNNQSIHKMQGNDFSQCLFFVVKMTCFIREEEREREGKLNAIWIGFKNSFHSFCYKFKLIGSLSWQKVEQVSITKEKLYIHNQRNVSHLSAIYYTLRVYKMTWKIGITLMYLIKQWWSNLEPMAWIELEARIIYINIILL